jgi:hypothetical protein
MEVVTQRENNQLFIIVEAFVLSVLPWETKGYFIYQALLNV